MLYDFLNYQNGIKENSIHATYLLYGQKKAQATQSDGDVEMGSSQPEQDSVSDPVVTDTLTLVAEESLKGLLQHQTQYHAAERILTPPKQSWRNTRR